MSEFEGTKRDINDKAFIYTKDIQIFLNKKARQKYKTLKCKYNKIINHSKSAFGSIFFNTCGKISSFLESKVHYWLSHIFMLE